MKTRQTRSGNPRHWALRLKTRHCYGICYTGGANQELTASVTNFYLKMRTCNNGNTMTFSVNKGYTITGIKVEAYSNNTSTTSDRSITLTGICIDGPEETVLENSVVFPGGTKGKTPVTAAASVSMVSA